MVLLACLKVLLYRYTAQEDICVGTPVAGRIQPELENQIGPYLNILPLRDSVAADDTFAAVLQQVRQTTLDAYANQFYPFDLILAGRSPERNVRRNPLFDVGFTLQNQSEARRRQPSRYLKVSEIVRDADAIEDAEAVTDFWFVASDDDGNLKWDVVYNGALFKPETAERLFQDLETIVSTAGADPDVKVGAIPLAGARGRSLRARVAIDMEL
jgi:non-ribosomal peptide synthetase component F